MEVYKCGVKVPEMYEERSDLVMVVSEGIPVQNSSEMDEDTFNSGFNPEDVLPEDEEVSMDQVMEAWLRGEDID